MEWVIPNPAVSAALGQVRPFLPQFPTAAQLTLQGKAAVFGRVEPQAHGRFAGRNGPILGLCLNAFQNGLLVTDAENETLPDAEHGEFREVARAEFRH